MDATEQRGVLDAIAEAAREEGCWIAPVGSVYFLLAGAPRMTTKDVDAVVHGDGLEPPSVDVLNRIAARLSRFGEASTTKDGAIVQVRSGRDAPPEIELIRGRSAANGGFFPRALLVAAAREARQDGNILLYPVEYILVLKADAAVDREDRAKRDPKRAEEHNRRADLFRSDVIAGVNTALLAGSLSTEKLNGAVTHLKKSRQARVRGLLNAAGVELAHD